MVVSGKEGTGTKLSAVNVQAIESFGAPGEYVAFSGRSYDLPGSALLWLRRDADGWRINRRTQLEARVHAYVAQPSGFVIATRTRVSLAATDGTIRPLAAQPHGWATPSSLAVSPSGEIAIGRRFFVSLLRPRGNTYNEEWFIPPALPALHAYLVRVHVSRWRLGSGLPSATTITRVVGHGHL